MPAAPALLASQLDTLQRATRSFNQNPTPALSSVIRRLHGEIRRNPQHKEYVMSLKLTEALQRYRTVLLETAVGDLLALKTETPRSASAAASAAIARKAVLDAAANLSAERFTAELMASGFLAEPK